MLRFGAATEVDGGIIPDIQAAVNSFNLGIAATRELLITISKKIGVRTYDGVFDNGMVEGCMFANGNIGTYHSRILNITTLCNVHRGNDDRIRMIVRGCITTEFFKQGCIRLQQGFFTPAIEPVLYFERLNLAPLCIIHSSASVRLNSP